MFKLSCQLPLLNKLEIFIKDKNLFDFSKRQLTNYIEEHSEILESKDYSVMINTTIKKEYKDIIFARKIKFENNFLHFTKSSRTQTINYLYDFNETLTIKIDFQKKIFFFLKSILKSRYEINHVLFYQIVLYPIFSLYNLTENYFLVHGSLLKYKHKYIVLTGLDGVGKSSLANELILNGAQIIADNFVLFNGKKFIGLNMPIRLELSNKTETNVIYKDDNLKEVLYSFFENNSVNVEQIYFLTISDEFTLEKIDYNRAFQNWNFINNGAGEILEANLFNIPFTYQNIFENNGYKYEKIDCFHLSIPEGKINKTLRDVICQLNI